MNIMYFLLSGALVATHQAMTLRKLNLHRKTWMRRLIPILIRTAKAKAVGVETKSTSAKFFFVSDQCLA